MNKPIQGSSLLAFISAFNADAEFMNGYEFQ